MATCNDCFHFEVCDSGRHIGEYENDDGVYTEGVEKECPTFKNKADFVEVKHGEWIEEYRGLCPREKVIVCNLCGRTTEIKEPYCHCGAKMSEISTGSKRSEDD